MGKTLKGLLALCASAAFVAVGFVSYRNNAMDRLYAEAGGDLRFFRGSREGEDAVRKLATYRGRRATEMLLTIAVSHGAFELGNMRTEAIKLLGMRNDAEVAVALANLLHPHEGLVIRKAVGDALRDLPCNGECVRTILHYHERVWRGEPNYEDRLVEPPDIPSVKPRLRKDQQALYSSLDSVLRREKVETLTNVVRVYGLGTDSPSAFALDLLPRLGLQEACPLLLQSAKRIEESSPDSYYAPRQELRAAIASLNCK